MKLKILTICCFALSTLLFSQNSNTKEADALFKKTNFLKAAEAYLKIAQSDKANEYIYNQLADSYYMVSNFKEAEKWYAKTLETATKADPIFRYAQSLKSNNKFSDYKKQMQKLADNFPNDLRAIDFLENPDFALSNSKEKFTIKELDFNSENSDFGAFFSNGNLYFASARNNTNKKFDWTNEPSLDIYKSIKSDNNTYATPVIEDAINSKFNDGPVSLTANGKTIYFSSETWRNNSFENNKKNHLKLSKNNIFKAESKDGKWINIVSLSINSLEFSTSNPCISRDGKTLYFSSNRPGGFGGVDIWKVAINDDGTCASPINLGNKVNTEANESFPFINDDNTKLYFSSNGKNGFGAYDVYEFDIIENKEAQNMGKPINTNFDDFAFSYYDETKLGYLSSNRTGNDNIFSVEKLCQRKINLIVKNEKTNKILENAKIKIVDASNQILFNEVTNNKGEASFELDCDKEYSVVIEKEGFDKKNTPVEPNSSLSKTIEVLLKPNDVIITDREVILQPIYFEVNRWNITPQGANELDKLVKVMNDYPNMVLFAKSHTDNRGSDSNNLSLSEKRAKSTVDYVVSKGIDSKRISGKGMGESEPKVSCVKCSEADHSQNRRSEFLIVKK